MFRKLIKISILVVLTAAVALAALAYRDQIRSVFAKPAAATDAAGRKVLYWYDAMNPQSHYDHPGKAPDGMDLVPKYADVEAASQGSHAGKHEKKVLYWYAPMNPSYHADHPGKSPMGMDLVPKYADEGAESMAPGTVKISPERQQLIGVRTGTAERASLTRTIRTTGYLTADETKISHIHVKVDGWIDKVYVDFVGQLVQKGQPLFTVYSPDLMATEQEYLIAVRGENDLGKSPYPNVSAGAQSLLDATRDRLKLWDISDAQIKTLAETGKVERTLTFYSPVTGFVVDRQAYPQSAVSPDKELYTVADLSDIWVDADIYEYEVPYVRVGQPATMQLTYYPGKTCKGTVSYIYPTVDPQTRTVKVRLQFPNPNFALKPGMFADVALDVNYGTHLIVPSSAVLNSGTRQLVFVARGDGYFEPRAIQVGPQTDDKYIVLSGLRPGETIVTSGNFLIDSESQLSAATEDMSPPPSPQAPTPASKKEAR